MGALAAACVLAGAAVFLAGTVGLLRFRDVYGRLHAVSKVDNLGLGLVLLGAAVDAWDPLVAARLALVWILALYASATVGLQLARAARARGVHPWRPEDPAP